MREEAERLHLLFLRVFKFLHPLLPLLRRQLYGEYFESFNLARVKT